MLKTTNDCSCNFTPLYAFPSVKFKPRATLPLPTHQNVSQLIPLVTVKADARAHTHTHTHTLKELFYRVPLAMSLFVV
jgi:hypothetical protein